MSQDFDHKFQALLDKYAELLTGESDQQTVDQVTKWALYTHIAKTMPPLAKHWNQQYPDAKEEMKNTSVRIKQKNEEIRKSRSSDNE